jgi:hypothetical protein
MNIAMTFATKLLPHFEDIGFVRGKATQFTSSVWLWEMPDGSVVPDTISDTENGCIMKMLRMRNGR